MKTTRIILLLLVPCFFLSMKCEKGLDCENKVVLNNQSNKTIYAVYSFDYPDTSITFQNPTITGTYIPAVQRVQLDNNFYGGCLVNVIESHSPSQTISIFLFDAELIRNTSWTQVRQNYQVLKRYDYTVDELRNTNFSIDFP